MDIIESILKTHSIVTSNFNKKTNELANIYVQNILDISEKSQIETSISYQDWTKQEKVTKKI